MIKTDVSKSEGEVEETVGAVVSVVVVSSVVVICSSFSPQEKMVKIKRKREKMMSRYFTKFPFGGLGEPNI